MNGTLLETERLLLREFTLADSNFIVELLNTEGWIKYIGDRNVKTTQDAERYLTNGPLNSYRTNGFGLSLVMIKTDGKPIGMCGLIQREHLDCPDIGFAFLPEYVGQGYAYEIAKKVVQHSMKQLHCNKILAITIPTNHSSITLLEKIGFTFERKFITPDTNEELCLYNIMKEG